GQAPRDPPADHRAPHPVLEDSPQPGVGCRWRTNGRRVPPAKNYFLKVRGGTLCPSIFLRRILKYRPSDAREKRSPVGPGDVINVEEVPCSSCSREPMELEKQRRRRCWPIGSGRTAAAASRCTASPAEPRSGNRSEASSSIPRAAS